MGVQLAHFTHSDRFFTTASTNALPVHFLQAWIRTSGYLVSVSPVTVTGGFHGDHFLGHGIGIGLSLDPIGLEH